jgi:hypothetical protein
MRVIMFMIPRGYEKAPVDAMPSAEAIAAMQQYTARLQEAGVLLSLNGLEPPAKGVRVISAAGRSSVTHGPFHNTTETVGGYWILQVSSMDEAIDWALRCPGDDDFTLELRRIQEMEDFPADVQAVLAEADQV